MNALTPTLLRRWPLAPIPADADKSSRGSILVIAGSREIPGAAMLAATAALRAGAGKVSIATAASVAVPLAVAMPEARVVGLAEMRSGAFRLAPAVDRIASMLARADAILIGPGLDGPERSAVALADAVLRQPGAQPAVVDAAAIGALRRRRFDRPIVTTPHAGEMAHLTGLDKDAIDADPLAHARAVARTAGIDVVLKGAETVIVASDGRAWHHAKGVIGLGASGSGDVLAGVFVALLARATEPVQAAAWGVVAHARAGHVLQQRLRGPGFLAREVCDALPQVLATLGAAR